MSQKIINQARILSEMIATSDELKVLRDTESKLANDPIAQDLMNEYQSWQAKLQALSQEGKELSPDEKAELDQVEAQMERNANLTAYRDAQANFSAMLESINYLIIKGINGNVDDDACPTGGCHSCNGCDF